MHQLTDPITEDDPFLDPDGPAAARVLRTATRRRPARRALPALLTAGATAAAAAVGLALLPGTNAQEALAQAAENTAAIAEGRVVTTVHTSMGDHRAEARNEMTFEGDDYAMVTHTKEVLPDGGRTDIAQEYRVIGDRAWFKDKDGRWKEVPAEDPAARDVSGAIEREMRDSRVLAAARQAPDLEREDRGDGTTVYRATVAARAGQVDPPPLPEGLVLPPARAAITVGADDVVREIVLESTGSRQVTTYETGDVPPIVAP